ncbi:hypothetical protein CASFOL_004396 [Castilleja foliolosa]|uniref:DUF1985 domain-containing protein n=1 Tax=Castilleja foliolosa TaxID=1961234 RepID=A0ABD3EEF1_9LAMI
MPISLKMRKQRLVLSEESSDGEMEKPASEEVEWTWKREGSQISKLQIYSKRKIVKEIAKGLKLIGEGVYRKFINSCFGFLMRFNTRGYCCTTALIRLFAHEVIKADANPDELWYRVGGRFIRFSRYEYALVTGLSFGPTTFDPSSKHVPPASGLFWRHYRGQRLKMDSLLHDFTDGVFRDSSDDTLKVAKLLIVYFLLFGLDEKQTYIDEWAWALIEDTNQWETFTWGKYTYEILLRHLRGVPTKEKATLSYRGYGFVWAFWIWALEAIPELGKACGVPTSHDVLPRCLRWEFHTMPRMDVDGFYDREMEVQSTLEPSAEEQRQPYWEHIHDNLQPVGCYVHQDNPLNKRTFVNPSSRVVLPVCRCQGSKAIPTRRSCSNSATPLIKKRKRDDPPTTSAPIRVAGQEKAMLKELSRIVRKELALVQQELPSVIRQELPSVIRQELPSVIRQELPSVIQQELPSVLRQEVHLVLKEFFSQRDSSNARDPTVGVQGDEAMVGTPVAPQGVEKYKCVDTMVVKIGREIRDLRDEKLAAIKTIEELRLKQLEADKVGEELKRKNLEANLKILESDKAVELCKSRLENLLPKSMNIEADMLTVEVVDNVRKLATSMEGRTLDIPEFKVDAQTVNNPRAAESSDTVKYNEHREPQTSGNIKIGFDGLNDEVSTSDSEDSCTDSRMDDLITSLRSKDHGRKWTYESDMLRAFQQDEELCMKAVCSLYRQQSFARKSTGRSKNGGFNPVDSMSGCALAKYLIDGDRELRLRKSVSEVKKECPDVISQCRKLATNYVEKLFQIYCAADDPFFGQS